MGLIKKLRDIYRLDTGNISVAILFGFHREQDGQIIRQLITSFFTLNSNQICIKLRQIDRQMQ